MQTIIYAKWGRQRRNSIIPLEISKNIWYSKIKINSCENYQRVKFGIAGFAFNMYSVHFCIGWYKICSFLVALSRKLELLKMELTKMELCYFLVASLEQFMVIIFSHFLTSSTCSIEYFNCWGSESFFVVENLLEVCEESHEAVFDGESLLWTEWTESIKPTKSISSNISCI